MGENFHVRVGPVSEETEHFDIQYNLDGSNTDDSFTMDDSNSFLSALEILSIAKENKYFGILRDIFLFYHKYVCCLYPLELLHRGDSNEYTQHIIIL